MLARGRGASGSLPRLMPEESQDDGGENIRARVSRQGEEALGKLADELLTNPVINSALTHAFEAREKATQAQETAMGALNLPSAADVERLTRRLRSVSQRLEGIEDMLDGIEGRLEGVSGAADGSASGDLPPRLDARLDEIAGDLAALRASLAPEDDNVPRAQERLTVREPSG